jgi:hypothetical protein
MYGRPIQTASAPSLPAAPSAPLYLEPEHTLQPLRPRDRLTSTRLAARLGWRSLTLPSTPSP